MTSPLRHVALAIAADYAPIAHTLTHEGLIWGIGEDVAQLGLSLEETFDVERLTLEYVNTARRGTVQ